MLKLFKHLSIVTISEMIEKGIIFLLFIYMGRVLPVDDFGYLNYILAILSYFVIFIDLGLPQLATREIAAYPILSEKMLQSIWALKSFFFVIVLIFWLVYVSFFEHEHKWFSLFMSFYLFARVADIFWYLQGKHDFETVAKIKLAKSLILLTAFVFLYIAPHFYVYPIVLVVALIAPFVYFAIHEGIAKNFFLNSIVTNLRKYQHRNTILFVKSIPLIVSTFLILLYYNLDTILIKYYLGYEAVARYNAAYKIVFAFIVVRSVFTSIVFPRMANQKYNWKEDKIFALIGIGVAIAIALFSYWFGKDILFTAYGEKYLSSEDVLFILSLTASVLWVNLFYPTFFVAVKKERFYMKVHIVTALLNLIGNIFLIPKYGIEGAALATLVADIVSLIIFGISYYIEKNNFKVISQ